MNQSQQLTIQDHGLYRELGDQYILHGFEGFRLDFHRHVVRTECIRAHTERGVSYGAASSEQPLFGDPQEERFHDFE